MGIGRVPQNRDGVQPGWPPMRRPWVLLALGAWLWLCGPIGGAENPALGEVSPKLQTEAAPGHDLYPALDGKAHTSLFGVTGEGTKFVYVFDRSGSMGGSGRTALRAVKAELQASLEHLDTVHQFQIIFYNDRPVIFNPSGSPGRLAFATEQNKRRAVQFIDSITADGGTQHEDALKLAVKLQPDVIFFLTDADKPTLTAAQLDKIGRWAAGITINAIEFGTGPQPDPNSFLVQLARQNGGQFAYVDVSKLPTADDKATGGR